jgi:Cu(I)/Ag(I) efflux system protein CusF
MTLKFKSGIAGLSILAAAGFSTLAQAQTAVPAASAAMPMGAGAMTDGEVRKIDRENKKITLKHGEIKNLEMPGMTMVFQVKDPAMLDMVKAGDKVMFKAEKANGALVVTEIQPVR